MNKLSTTQAFQNTPWRKALLLSLVLAFLLTPLLALQATSARADGWVIECVDFSKLFSEMTDRSLRLDAAGHPHVAYGGDRLYYAYYNGMNWNLDTVDDSPGVGRYASLVLDGGEYPHISYYDDTNLDLKYAYQNASGWHILTVDSDGLFTYTSLVLDVHRNTHIRYRNY